MPKRANTNEPNRYLENARKLLARSPIEHGTYADIKYVQLGCGAAYLAILKALDDYLIRHGVDPKRLPKSVEGYREMIRKHLSMYDGSLSKKFEALYWELHVAGHYRGLLRDVNVVKETLKSAEGFIDKLGSLRQN